MCCSTDATCLLGNVAVVASEKGVVVGRLTFVEDGDTINCSRMGVGGKAIPPNIDKVSGCVVELCCQAADRDLLKEMFMFPFVHPCQGTCRTSMLHLFFLCLNFSAS